MDQVKKGNLIAQYRSEKGFTQAALAERLGVSDRAVSKWKPADPFQMQIGQIL